MIKALRFFSSPGRRPARRVPPAVMLCVPMLGVSLLSLAAATPALAQISPGTLAAPFASAGALNIHGNDSAHDPNNDVYLAVGAWGPVYGAFVNRSGQAVSSVFQIGSGVATAVRVRYSQQLNGGSGGFMVAWTHESNPWEIRTRVVAYPGTVLGSEQAISGGTGADGTRAPALAYSPASQRFLVAWSTPLLRPFARLVDLNGQGVGDIIDLSAGGPGGFAKDVSVAFNPNRNEFGVSYSGEIEPGAGRPAGYNYSTLLIVPPGNPTNFHRTTFNAVEAVNMRTITDLDYSTSTNRYVMAWFEYVMARTGIFDESGTQLHGDIASVRVGVHDSLSIAYNPVSQTFLLGGLDPQNDNLTGVELNNFGIRIGSEVLLGPAPAFLTRVSTSRTTPQWLATYARNYNLAAMPVQTGSVNGGGGSSGGNGGSTAPPPPPPTDGGGSTGGSSSSCPGFVPGQTCVNGEWVLDTSGGSGGSTSTGDSNCPGFVPGQTCVNGEWVVSGSTSTGGSTGGDGTCHAGVLPGMTCVNGNYIPTESLGGGGTTSSSGGSSCPGFVPGQTCVNGNWVVDTGGTVSSTGGSSCPGFVPGQTCVNGNWVVSTGSGGSSAGDGTCHAGVLPGMTCVNGTYIPTESLGGGGGTSSLPVCTDGNLAAPGPTWVRVGSFDWLPPDHPNAVFATCRAQ